MLTKELKEKWIAALRSGRYRQGRHALCTTVNKLSYPIPNPQYCCLGVLCEVAGIEKREQPWGAAYKVPSASGEWTIDLTPENVAGLPYEYCSKLVGLNDTGGLSFPEIADWIEANLPTEPDGQEIADPSSSDGTQQ